MKTPPLTKEKARIADLEARLAEAEETLRAIQAGEVDALVVSRPGGNQVFTLQGADTPYRFLIEEMNEGALLLAQDGTVLYANARFAQWANVPLEQLIGSSWERFFMAAEHQRLADLLNSATRACAREELHLQSGTGFARPVAVSIRSMQRERLQGFSVAVTDLTESKRAEDVLRQAHDVLEQRVAERTAQLSLSNSIQVGINQILQASLACETEQALGRICLEIAERLTQSKFGFIGDINKDGLEDITISSPALAASKVLDASGQPVVPRNFKIHGIYGRVIKEGKALFTNDPAHHPDSIGLPTGHFRLESFLGVPLMREGRVIGILAVANREGGYSQRQQDALEALIPAIVEAFLRKRAEQAMRQARERLSLAQNAGRVGVFDRDLTTNDVFWTPELEQIFGLPQGSFENRYEGWTKRVHPDDLPRIESLFAAWLQSDRDEEKWEYRFLRQGEERWISARGRIIRESAGKPVRMIGTNIDITERKLAEAELYRLNRTLRALSRSSQVLSQARRESDYLAEVCKIVVEDCGHAMVWIGYAEEDEAKSVRPVAQAGFAKGYLKTLNVTWADTELGRGPTGTAVRTGKLCGCSNVLTDPRFKPWREDAVKRGYASSMGLPLLFDGKAFGALTIYSRQPDPFSEAELRLLTELADDIANGIMTIRSRLVAARAEEELRKMAAELSRSNRDLEQFAYVASHDLQEPLRAVVGYSKMLELRLKDKLDDPKVTEYVNGAAEGAVRMEALITDLLAFARVGTRGEALLPVDLNAPLGEALYSLQTSIKKKQARVTSDTLPTLSADGAQIRQLFQNLIGNALKFCDKPVPEIHIGARQEEGRWVISVRDNGIGIGPEYFGRVFKIFQRLHTQKAYPGTGVGLAICQRIVERHNGKIWIESQPGQGTTFYFSIPETPLKPHEAALSASAS